MASKKNLYEARIKGTDLRLVPFPMDGIDRGVEDDLVKAGYTRDKAELIAPYAWYHSSINVRTDPREFIRERVPREILEAIGVDNIMIGNLDDDFMRMLDEADEWEKENDVNF